MPSIMTVFLVMYIGKREETNTNSDEVYDDIEEPNKPKVCSTEMLEYHIYEPINPPSELVDMEGCEAYEKLPNHH